MDKVIDFKKAKNNLMSNENIMELNDIFEYISEKRSFKEKYNNETIEWARDKILNSSSCLNEPIQAVENFALSYKGIFPILRDDKNLEEMADIFITIHPEYNKSKDKIFTILKDLSEYVVDSVFDYHMEEEILAYFILEVYDKCDVNIIMAAECWLNYYNSWIIDYKPFTPDFDPNPYNNNLFNINEFIGLMPKSFKNIYGYKELTKIIFSFCWSLVYDPYFEVTYGILLENYKKQLDDEKIDKNQYKKIKIEKDIGFNDIKFTFYVDKKIKDKAEKIIEEGIKKCNLIKDYYAYELFEDIYDDVLYEIYLKEIEINNLKGEKIYGN